VTWNMGGRLLTSWNVVDVDETTGAGAGREKVGGTEVEGRWVGEKVEGVLFNISVATIYNRKGRDRTGRQQLSLFRTVLDS